MIFLNSLKSISFLKIVDFYLFHFTLKTKPIKFDVFLRIQNKIPWLLLHETSFSLHLKKNPDFWLKNLKHISLFITKSDTLKKLFNVISGKGRKPATFFFFYISKPQHGFCDTFFVVSCWRKKKKGKLNCVWLPCLMFSLSLFFYVHVKKFFSFERKRKKSKRFRVFSNAYEFGRSVEKNRKLYNKKMNTMGF